jgi:hypothetical protein
MVSPKTAKPQPVKRKPQPAKRKRKRKPAKQKPPTSTSYALWLETGLSSIIEARAKARGVTKESIVKECVRIVIYGDKTSPVTAKRLEGNLMRTAMIYLILSLRAEKNTWKEIAKKLQDLGYERPYRRGVLGPKMVRILHQRAMKAENLEDLARSTLDLGGRYEERSDCPDTGACNAKAS